MFCTNCGKEVEADWVKCPYCSAELKALPSAGAKSEKQADGEKGIGQDTGHEYGYKRDPGNSNKKPTNKDNRKMLIRTLGGVAAICLGLFIVGVIATVSAPKEKGDNETKEAKRVTAQEEPNKTEAAKIQGEETEPNEDANKKSPKPAVELKDIDISNYKNKPIDELLADVKGLKGDGNAYTDSTNSVTITVDGDKKINSVTIKGNPRVAPCFGKARLEDNIAGFSKKIGDDYLPIPTVTALSFSEDSNANDFRERNTTNRFTVIYENATKKVTEMSWVSNGLDFILPDSSEEAITEDRIAELTDTERQMAVNEIFARHGREFKDPDIQAYYNSKEWYKGTVAPEAFDEHVLNPIEKDNIDRLSNVAQEGNSTKSTDHSSGDNDYINGYLRANTIIPEIIKNPDKYIGKKVYFNGLIQKNFNGILELSYIQSDGKCQATVYYDKEELGELMPDAPINSAIAIVYGNVIGASKDTGVEIQMGSMYLGTNDINYPKNNDFIEHPSYIEMEAGDDYDVGNRFVLEGTLVSHGYHGFDLKMEEGLCELASTTDMGISQSKEGVEVTFESFLNKRVRVYGIYLGHGPTLAVSYIEPLD